MASTNGSVLIDGAEATLAPKPFTAMKEGAIGPVG